MNTKKKMIRTTLLFEADTWNKFATIATLNNTTASEILRTFVAQYIENHKDAAAKKLAE
jgi:hypothetical protein